MNLKYTEKSIAEARVWIETHGVSQPGGCTIRQCCEALGISDDTWRAWLNKPEFADMVQEAQAVFHKNTVKEVENALLRAALGYNATNTRKDVTTDKEADAKGNPVIVRQVEKEVTETRHIAPNVGAAIFLLCNMEPERWQQKQSTDLNVGGTLPQLSIKILENGEAVDEIKRDK